MADERQLLIDERAFNVAAELVPAVVQILDTTLDQWLDEMTTLSGDEKVQYRKDLRRECLREIGRQLLVRHGHFQVEIEPI